MKDVQEDRTKREKMLKRGLIILGVFLIILVVILVALKFLDSKTNKIFIDEREVSYEKLIHDIDGELYVDLPEMARLFPAFTYNKGEYLPDGTVNQKPNYFHLKSPYEVIQFSKDSSNVSKIILINNNYYQYDSNGKKILTKEEISSGKEIVIEKQEIDNKKRSTEEFLLSKEVLDLNDKQYIPLDDIKYVFNVQLKTAENSIKLYTVEYLERAYATALSRSNLSLNPNYQNRRAILDGYFIVTTNPTNPVYGVQLYKNDIFTTQISESYKDIRYMQTNKTIFVINNQNGFGLININEAVDIIKPGLYESIEAYFPNLDLYQVTNLQGKLGIIQASGKEEAKQVVHTEYDVLGFDTSSFFDKSDGKVFFGSLIPAQKDNKWYIFDLENPENRYGSNIEGYFDLGYKKPELITVRDGNQINFTNGQIKELTERGHADLVKKISYNDKETFDLRIPLLEREGFVTSASKIPEGESTLIVPDSTGYGGLIVKSRLNTGEYVYYIISSDPKIRASDYPYALQNPFKRIYQLTIDGVQKYYAIGVGGNSLKYELKKQEPVQEKKEEDNINPNENTGITENPNENTGITENPNDNTGITENPNDNTSTTENPNENTGTTENPNPNTNTNNNSPNTN